MITLNVYNIVDFFDLWGNSLTKIGKEFKEEIKKHFVDTYFSNSENSFMDEIIESCYINKTAQCGPQEYFSKIVSLKMRQSENNVREILGISKIGEGNVSETKLYYEIKTKLPQYNVIHQGNPKWLGRQRLDIYIPELNVAIEYQGGQHFDPNHYHNSHNPDSFEKNKERDERKRFKCESNGCKIIYVYEGVNYNITDVVNQILDVRK
jgi:very-short-patch-repair endonuclease